MACIIDSEMNYKWINFYWLSAVVGEKKNTKDHQSKFGSAILSGSFQYFYAIKTSISTPGEILCKLCKLCKTFCQSFPSYHAFAGYHYTVPFYRRGKLKPLKVLGKNVKYQQMFYNIGVSPTITAPMIVLFKGYLH